MTMNRRDLALGLGLSAWVVLLAAIFPTVIDDWGYHLDGARLLFSSDALRVYAERPDIAIGPLSLALTGAIDLATGATSDATTGAVVRWFIAACFGPVVLLARRATASSGAPSTNRVMVIITVLGGLVAGLGWAALANSRHLDDALATVLVLLTIATVGANRSRAAGAMAALAVWAKPWAIATLPVLQGLKERQWRAWATAGLVLLPLALFVLVDLQAVNATRVGFTTHPLSTLTLIGPDTGSWTWVRVVQLVAATATGALVARRSIWCAPAAAFVVRLLLDPGVWPYYFGPLLVLTLLADLSRPRRPWATPLAALVLVDPFGTAGTGTVELLLVLLVLVIPVRADAVHDEGPRPSDGGLRSL